MRLQEVGDRSRPEQIYLREDWHSALTDKQLEAYLRYLFIYSNEGVINWEDDAHTKKRAWWDGGRDNFSGTRYKNIWDKILRALKRVNAHPGLWVAAHFSPSVYAVRTAQGKGLISGRPELLASDESANIYAHYLENFAEYFAHRYAAAEASFTTRYAIMEPLDLPHDDKILSIVCDVSHVNAPPFLRHAFAANLNCERGARKFLWAAALDYEMRQPLYDKYIADNPTLDWFVPDHLLKHVAGIRKHWSSSR
jgi:hypothetical protein